MSLFSDLFQMFGGGPGVGVSVGSSSVKVAVLGGSGKKLELEEFAVAPLPNEAVSQSEVFNEVALSETLRGLVKTLKLKNKPVCTALSGNNVVVKKIEMEVTNPKELNDQIAWEAEQYLPFDIQDVYLDYQVLQKTKEQKTEVIVVAVKKNLVEIYKEIFSKAQLSLSLIDLDIFSLQNVFELNYPDQIHQGGLLVDLGAKSSKVMITYEGKPLFTKEIAFGNQKLTEDIQKQLGLSMEDAEALKVGSSSTDLPREALDLIAGFNEQMTLELKKVFDFYKTTAEAATVEFVFLAGGGARTLGVSEALEETLKIPVQLFHPFHKIHADAKSFPADYLEKIGPVAAIPLGLAWRAKKR